MEQSPNAEPPQPSPNEKKAQELNKELSRLAHESGLIGFNIEDAQNKVADIRLKMRNIIVDLNKVGKKIDKERAEKQAEASQAKDADNKLELIQ